MKAPSATAVQLDLDLMNSRRAFPEAQALFDGAALSLVAEGAKIAWHGSDLHPETGCIALVREDGPHVDLIGEIVKVSRTLPTKRRTVFAYVYATAAIDADLSLARRTFMGLGILANESLDCRLEIIA